MMLYHYWNSIYMISCSDLAGLHETPIMRQASIEMFKDRSSGVLGLGYVWGKGFELRA